MPLKIKDGEKETELFPPDWSSVNFGAGRYLTLTNKDGSEEIEIGYALKFDKGTASPDEYRIYIFKNECISENEPVSGDAIFQISSKSSEKKTVGYIFSIQEIISGSHEDVKDKYFIRYASKAFYKLLRQDDGIPFVISENGTDFKLTDFYPDDSFILILWEKELKNFNINHYLPFLYKYGYRYVTDIGKLSDTIQKEHLKKEIETLNIKAFEIKKLEKRKRKIKKLKKTKAISKEIESLEDKIKEIQSEIEKLEDKIKIKEIKTLDKRIILKPISEDLGNEDYITQLFINLLPYQEHPLVIFHLLYQVIELLMSKIAMRELKKIIEKARHPEYRSLSDMKEDLEKLQKIQQEKGNIKKLFSSVQFFDKQDQKLKSECEIFLKMQEPEKQEPGPEKQEPAEFLYKTRNLIVHEYRNLKERALIEEKINIRFEKMLIDLLIEYPSD